MPHSFTDSVFWGALLLAAFFGFMLIVVIRRILLGIQAKQWPYVVGQLVSAEDRIRDAPGEEDYTREIVVSYVYQVDGREYKGTRIHPFYGRGNMEGKHIALKAILTPGVHVRVYYSPARPQSCMLSPGYYSYSLAPVFGVLFFLGMMLVVALAIGNHPGTGFAEGIQILP